VNTNSSGTTVGQQGHYPFGESWYATSTTTKWQFTSYERDSESTLDYAMLRYHCSRLGRFMTPDRIAGSIANPQSLNRYAYVGNNPVNFVDPLGLNRSPFDDEVGVSIACISFYYPVMRAMSDERIVEFYESAMWCTVNRSDGSGGGGGGVIPGKPKKPDSRSKKARLAECKTPAGRANALEQLAQSFLNNTGLNQFVSDGPTVNPGDANATVEFRTNIREHIPSSASEIPPDSFRFPGEPSAELEVQSADGKIATIDYDRFNAGRKDLWGFISHGLFEVFWHKLSGTQTNPCKIRETLMKQGRFNP
jgi:RHS repeat-associated protein